MNTVVTLLNYQPSHSTAFLAPLSLEALRRASAGGLCRFGPREPEPCVYLHLHERRCSPL